MRTPTFIFKRVISMTLLIFVSWTIAGAYTIVFYGGNRVEIPDNFTVTSNAVIYEAAPGVNVSFRLKSIDIPATERANDDSAGSFLGRTGAHRVQAPPSTTATQKATRTITNRDLEPYESARLRSEATWEKRRKELGLPSLEETRREAARREAALDEFLAKKRLEQEANRRHELEAKLFAETAARMNATAYQGGQSYWPTGNAFFDNGAFGPFDSSFRFGRGFPFGVTQGSPCGFNPSASCLLSHPFSLFNQGSFRARRMIFGAPRRIVGGHR
ncbi:MAG TPA: hypothetical protein VF074_17075, partial [Pyrinomonadaceae bacterium]